MFKFNVYLQVMFVVVLSMFLTESVLAGPLNDVLSYKQAQYGITFVFAFAAAFLGAKILQSLVIESSQSNLVWMGIGLVAAVAFAAKPSIFVSIITFGGAI